MRRDIDVDIRNQTFRLAGSDRLVTVPVSVFEKGEVVIVSLDLFTQMLEDLGYKSLPNTEAPASVVSTLS